MRKKSTKHFQHRHQVKILKSEVISSRIAWLNFLETLRSTAKISLALVTIAVLGFGIKKAIQHTFHQNTDFRLKAINLNQNDYLNEVSLIELLKIDLSSNIFDIKVDELEAKLREQPAIRTASVDRNLPGTLNFQISIRKPIAWVKITEEQTSPKNITKPLLVDDENYIYSCQEGQKQACLTLPVIHLRKLNSHPLKEQTTIDHPEYRNTLRLLKLIKSDFPEIAGQVKQLSQPNDWSLLIELANGTLATFGLGDHTRQMSYLIQALHVAGDKNYHIKTINLIPERNVPITIDNEPKPANATLAPDSQMKFKEKQSQVTPN